MEASKERLCRDTVRDATQREIQQLKHENGELKQLVPELSLDVHRLKKRRSPCSTMSVSEGERHTEGGGPGQGGFVTTSQAADAQRPGNLQEHLLPVDETAGPPGTPRPVVREWDTMEPLHTTRGAVGPGGGTAITLAEQPPTGEMDHQYLGLLRIRVHCIPHTAQGGAREISSDAYGRR